MSFYRLKNRFLYLSRATRQSLIAISLVGLVFFSAAASAVGLGGHLHGSDLDHTAMHSDFLCAWMCAASSFVIPSIMESPFYWTPLFASISLFFSLLFSMTPRNVRSRAPPSPV